MTRYIDQHRDRFGVESICHALQIAPSSYYAAKRRQPSARAISDAELAPKILRAWKDNYQVYGARKLWKQLRREGELVGRDRIARLMRTLGIAGAVRGKTRRTTIADPAAVRAPDLVKRQFTATRPNQLWVSDFTYVATWSGTVYVAFVIDAFSRLIVGWRSAASMRTELVLDALEMAIWRRASVLEGLVCHSDAGSQGGFNWSSQRLDSEGLRWEQESVEQLIVPVVRRCVRRAVHRWDDASTDSGSGWRSPAGPQAKMPAWRPACPRPWDHAGSVKAVACQPSAAPRCQGATCRSPSEKSSPSSAPKTSGCARPHGTWGGLPRPSPGNCAATPRPVAGAWSIGPRPPNGTLTGVLSAPRSPSWLPTSGSGAMCSNGWRARSGGPTA
jgi:putative transposase